MSFIFKQQTAKMGNISSQPVTKEIKATIFTTPELQKTQAVENKAVVGDKSST